MGDCLKLKELSTLYIDEVGKVQQELFEKVKVLSGKVWKDVYSKMESALHKDAESVKLGNGNVSWKEISYFSKLVLDISVGAESDICKVRDCNKVILKYYEEFADKVNKYFKIVNSLVTIRACMQWIEETEE